MIINIKYRFLNIFLKMSIKFVILANSIQFGLKPKYQHAHLFHNDLTESRAKVFRNWTWFGLVFGLYHIISTHSLTYTTAFVPKLRYPDKKVLSMVYDSFKKFIFRGLQPFFSSKNFPINFNISFKNFLMNAFFCFFLENYLLNLSLMPH